MEDRSIRTKMIRTVFLAEPSISFIRLQQEQNDNFESVI